MLSGCCGAESTTVAYGVHSAGVESTTVSYGVAPAVAESTTVSYDVAAAWWGNRPPLHIGGWEGEEAARGTGSLPCGQQ